jgi:hypothetical protein
LNEFTRSNTLAWKLERARDGWQGDEDEEEDGDAALQVAAHRLEHKPMVLNLALSTLNPEL